MRRSIGASGGGAARAGCVCDTVGLDDLSLGTIGRGGGAGGSASTLRPFIGAIERATVFQSTRSSSLKFRPRRLMILVAGAAAEWDRPAAYRAAEARRWPPAGSRLSARWISARSRDAPAATASAGPPRWDRARRASA